MNSPDAATASKPPADSRNAFRSFFIVSLPPRVVARLVSCQSLSTLGNDVDDRRRHSRIMGGGGCCGRSGQCTRTSGGVPSVGSIKAESKPSTRSRPRVTFLTVPARIRRFQLLLMSRIQSGDGTGRTDAEDEEHKPFSHGSASSSRQRLPSASKCSCTHLRQVASWLCGVCAAGFG